MGLLDLFRKKQKNSAIEARNRLQIIIAQDKADASGPDYLPLLKRELLEVIRKYVSVNPDAVEVNFSHESGHDLLELNIVLPDQPARTADGA